MSLPLLSVQPLNLRMNLCGTPVGIEPTPLNTGSLCTVK